ncbi:MAG TPA: PepSY domain-containing protein [Methylophilaceae bacterium]|nr:PepSY domain-containing protein [Methylophilaceae bacterium]
MIRLSIGVSVLTLVLITNAALAESDHGKFKAQSYDSLGKCVEKVLAKHDGEIVKLEYHVEDKKPTYEFDIEMPDGKAWEVECNVKTGEITELEQEVAVDDEKFASKAKFTEEQARATALAAHPGRIVEVEYEIESEGKVSYEIDILQKDNDEVKVEVDATTGKIVEVSYESYQIGDE